MSQYFIFEILNNMSYTWFNFSSFVFNSTSFNGLFNTSCVAELAKEYPTLMVYLDTIPAGHQMFSNEEVYLMNHQNIVYTVESLIKQHFHNELPLHSATCKLPYFKKGNQASEIAFSHFCLNQNIFHIHYQRIKSRLFLPCAF